MARKKSKKALGVSGNKKKGKSSRKHLEGSTIDKEKEASGSEYFPSSDDEGKAHLKMHLNRLQARPLTRCTMGLLACISRFGKALTSSAIEA